MSNFFLCFLSLFFVASTSNGHRLKVNYNLEYIFNENNYLMIFFIFVVFLFKKSNYRLSKFDYIYLLLLFLFINLNLIRWLYVDPAFAYVLLLLTLFPFLKRISSNVVLLFIKYNLIILTLLLILKILDLFYGTRFSPFIDSEYFAAGTAVSESGVYRLSNSLIFGQRNLAGAYLASLVILYTCQVKFTKKQSIFIFLYLFILILSTFSATALLIYIICLAYLNIHKFDFLKSIIAIILFVMLFLFIGFDRKLDSFLTKLNTFINFYDSLTISNFFIGNLDVMALRPYFESSLLDLIYDLGVFSLLIVFLYPISYFNSTFNYSLKLFCLTNYLLLFSLSNSTISPPVIVVFMLTISFIGFSYDKKNNI